MPLCNGTYITSFWVNHAFQENLPHGMTRASLHPSHFAFAYQPKQHVSGHSRDQPDHLKMFHSWVHCSPHSLNAVRSFWGGCGQLSHGVPGLWQDQLLGHKGDVKSTPCSLSSAILLRKVYVATIERSLSRSDSVVLLWKGYGVYPGGTRLPLRLVMASSRLRPLASIWFSSRITETGISLLGISTIGLPSGAAKKKIVRTNL